MLMVTFTRQNGIITLPIDTNDIAISTEGYVFADGQIIDRDTSARF